MKIKCKLLGVPEILIDKKEVLFPYAKINAFLYYLLVEKTASRNEIAALLWPDESEKIAKKNLRNALYHTKKNLHPDIILSPNNTILKLNEEIDIYLDVDELSENSEKRLHLYEGEFLQGFYIKDAEEYDDWIGQTRFNLQKIYYNTLYKKLEANISMGIYENVETTIQKLISMDNLDEKNYQLLMNYYLKIGRVTKAIETYGELLGILQKELKIEPDEVTKKLYNYSLSRLNLVDENLDMESFQFGREEEIARIINVANRFKNKNEISAIFVDGEIGIGKSTLIKRVFYDLKDSFIIISIRCIQLDILRQYSTLEILMKSFQKYNVYSELSKDISEILKKIKEVQKLHTFSEEDLFAIGELESLLEEFFEKIGKNRNLIIHFEDIHWMDLNSLSILNKMLLRNENILYFLSGRSNGNIAVDDLISTLSYYSKLEKVKLNRFSKDSSINYLKRAIPDWKDNSILEEIYEKSEGLPLFMWEYSKLARSGQSIKDMTLEMENSIKSRFTYLNEEYKEMVGILSFFTEGFFDAIVPILFKKKDEEIVRFLDELLKRDILKESVYKNNIVYNFTHERIREYLYSTISKTKRKNYHNEIGNYLEKINIDGFDGIERSQALAYHFREAGEFTKELNYNIEILNHRLNFVHELFPVLGMRGDRESNKMQISQEEAKKMLRKLKEDLDKVKNNENYESIQYLELKLDYMRGRYLIRCGNYEDGLEDIKYVIKRSIVLKEKDYEINGYKQMIFYNIQRNNPTEMIKYIDKSLELAVECNYHSEIGMFLRLKGLYYLMIGEYKVSEGFLRESISSFSVTKSIADIYSINIAAAHNYIGELKFAQKEYDEAIRELKKSIELSENKQAFSSLMVFYTNIGKVYFAKGDLINAHKYFNLALQLNNDLDSFWKVPVLDAYMALTQMYRGNFQVANDYLKTAVEHSRKMDDPRDLGTVNFASYVIYKKTKDTKDFSYFKNILTEDSETYRKLALENLDEFRDVFEINICKNGKDLILEV